MGTIENTIEIEIKDAKSSVQELISSLEELTTTINKSINSTETNKMKQNVDSSINKINILKKTISFGAIAVGLRQGFNLVKDIAEANIDLIETNNLFEVSMGKVVDEYGNLDTEASKYYIKAMAFQDEMNEKLGTNKSELKQYQAMYYSMLKSQGINKDASYLMSESLTKAGYDIASLYNLEINEAMEKIQSGLAGQIEGLRQIGIDVSESSLSKILNDVGITDRSVQQLSYAEKEVARYIAIMEQAGQAQGDFAKTFESPANQIRVFKNQLLELKQVAGSFIVNTFGNIIVYVNAVVMTIKEVLKSLASLFGYDLDTSNSNSSVGSVVDDIDDGLDSAVDKAKELKKQLMGFDEINNIAPETSSNSNSSGTITGIDDKLLNALTEWDNKMSSISGKAQEIRDKMLEWLGFHRTDEGGWELNEGLTNMEKLLDVVKTIGIAIGTWKVSSTITDLMKNLGLINQTQSFKIAFGLTLLLTGIYAQYKGTEHLLNGDADLFTILQTLLGTAGGTFGIVNLINATRYGKLLNLGQKLQIGLGVMMLIQGMQVAITGISEGDITKQILGALQSGFGGFLIGNSIGGLKFGLKVALVITIATIAIELAGAILKDDALNEVIENTKELSSAIEESNNSYKERIETIDDSVNSQITELEYAKKLKEQLEKIVDENGNVKKGYEERADYILGELNTALGTEYKRNGKVIDSYKEMKNEIDKVIEEKKKKIQLEALEEKYKEALKKQIEDTENLTKAQDNYNKALEEYEEWRQNSNPLMTGTYEFVMHEKALKDAEEQLNNMKQTAEETTNEVAKYESLLTLNTINTSEEISAELTGMGQDVLINMVNIAKSSTSQFLEELEKYSPAVQASLMAQTETLDQTSPQVIEKWKQLAENSSAEFMNGIAKAEPSVQAQVLASITTVNNLTPNMKTAWSNLAQQSETKFTEAINQIPVDARGAILNSITQTNGLTSKTANAWAQLAIDSRNEYNIALSTLPEDTRKKIQSAVKAINSQKSSAKSAGKNVAKEVSSGLNTINGKSIGQSIISGVASGIRVGGKSVGLSGAISSVVSSITGLFKNMLGIHSPSKVMAELSQYIPEGIAKGIEDNAYQTIKPVENIASGITEAFSTNVHIPNIMKELNDGIKINPKDYSVNTNQFIDYGRINGEISTQSNVTLSSNLTEEVREAVIEGMRNSTVQVEIEAKTDDGVIVKKSIKGINDYVIQTGELPFAIPV